MKRKHRDACKYRLYCQQARSYSFLDIIKVPNQGGKVEAEKKGQGGKKSNQGEKMVSYHLRTN